MLTPDAELRAITTAAHPEIVAAVRRLLEVEAIRLVESLPMIAEREQAMREIAEMATALGVFADMTGRRRVLLEAEAATSAREFYLQAVDEFGLLDTIRAGAGKFVRAVRRLLERKPVLARTAVEVAEHYQRGFGVAFAKSTSKATTEKVHKIMAGEAARGASVANGREAVAVAGKWGESYAETVWRTNMSTAYTAGRMKQAQSPAIKRALPAFEVIGSNDADTRRGRPKDRGENHLAALGLIAGTSDPIWDTHSPPFGYSCRHTLRLVGKPELRRKGLMVGNVVKRYTPPSFAAFSPHPNFAESPMRRVYGG